jgi:hypothetical protein
MSAQFLEFWTTPDGTGVTHLQRLRREVQFSKQCAMFGDPEPGAPQDTLYTVENELRKYNRS